MIDNKHIGKIAASLIAITVAFCMLMMVFADKLGIASSADSGMTMEYESELFDTSKIISINIEMDEDQWNDLLDNATDEEYHECNVEVNGTMFYNVGIRAKGNTSLSSVANSGSDRFSLKLEFDHYVDGQTCFGLDKLVLNNNYADATNMKEALTYDMFEYLGVDAPLYNYADISVNDSYWGVYLALESVDDSFMLRNYGSQSGELYKPDSMSMNNMDNFVKDDDTSDDNGGQDGDKPDGAGMPGGGQMPDGAKDGQMPDFSQKDAGGNAAGSTSQDGSGTTASGDQNTSDTQSSKTGDGSQSADQTGDGTTDQQAPGGAGGQGGGPGGGGVMGSGGGANLEYTDDDLDSYSTIWDSEVTKSGDSDHERVIKALKNISEGNNLEDYMDVDNILKYMAVHTFVVNLDSFSGNMDHNYYLYESEGKLNIIPWDYNLAYGGFSGGGGGRNSQNSDSASSMINYAIDTPFSGTTFFDTLLENDDYLAQYHGYLKQLCDEYVNGGRLDQVYDRIRSQIDDLVSTDPTAFYTYDEYDAGAKMLYNTIKLRAESVLGQLDGSIPSTDEGQEADSSALTDASSIDVSVMGQMMNGGGGGNAGGQGQPPGAQNTAQDNGQSTYQAATGDNGTVQTADTDYRQRRDQTD